jgi:CRISPR system Cascade subunit CasE
MRRHVPAGALRALLLPDDAGRRAGAGHRLVWTLFADTPDRERDFLWRETDGGTFYILSRREPADAHAIFDLDPSKPFAPALAAGDRLAFSLRANATVARKEQGRDRGKPVDVVMAAIHSLPKGERAGPRIAAVASAGRRWIESQGARCGFSLAPACDDDAEGVGGEGAPPPALQVTGYRTLRVDHRGPDARLGVLDFEGVLEVRDTKRFLEALGRGFGRAKAFGCGLMLIRRARGPDE